MGNPEFLPFKPLRAFLYTPMELAEKDASIYAYYKKENTVASRMAYALHDFSILDAMLDYSEGKTFVAVMGGHQVKRGDISYERLVQLGNLIANTGFICVTGGGPGAMEATNLGAYLSSQRTRRLSELMECTDETLGRDRSYTSGLVGSVDCSDEIFEYKGNEEAIQEALSLLREPVEGFAGEEMHNASAAQRVIDRFGPTQCYSPSVGIPTWFYGHEPSNIFASYQVLDI